MTLVTAFFWLLFAHLLADYPLQGDFLANMKGKNAIVLFSHAGIWTGCIMLGLTLTGHHPEMWMGFNLFTVHTVADLLKARKLAWYKRMDALKGGLLVDQLIHVAQIITALLAC